ncbi:MAG: Wzz/FepE/Etk N-terminal domain-containing protein, partial [Candidatus Eisenbacteria bacterium]
MSIPIGSTAPRPIELQELLRMAARRRWLLLGPWLAALVCGVAAAFLLKPVYFSSTTLFLERPQQLSGPLGGMVGGSDNTDQQAEILRDQVQSSLFLRTVITAAGLRTDPVTRAWALRAGGLIPGVTEDESVETFLVDYLRRAIIIRRQKGDIFVVTVGDYTAARARRVAVSVADQFVLSSKAAQLEAVRATQEFSTEQQQIYRRQLQESEARLESARRSSMASTLSGGVVTGANLITARTLADQSQSEMEEQRQRLVRLRGQFPPEVRDNDPSQLTSVAAGRLAAQIAGLERQLANTQLTSTVGTGGDGGGAARLDLSRKVGELEAELSANAARALPSMSGETRDLLVRYRLAQADYEARKSRHDFLRGEISGYERRVVSAPDQDMTIARLQQQVDSDRALFNSFLQQSAA